MPKGYAADGTPAWKARKTHGAPARPRKDLLWRHIDKGKPDGCWEWTGAKSNSGYGQFWNQNASRVVVAQILSDAGVGLSRSVLVCHRCHNPSCCNPKHLYIGTYSDNSRDRDHPEETELRCC